MNEQENTPAPKKATDVWQWIAIVAILLTVICGVLGLFAYVRAVDVVTSPEREQALQEQLNAQATQMAELQDQLKNPAASATAMPGPTNAPVEPSPIPSPTEEPATTQADDNSNVVWLVGGRLDDKSVGYEYVSVANSALIIKGTPLQPFFEQVTEATFANTLSLTPQHEILNDGVQFVIIGERAYIMPRESTSTVAFWSISWLQYDPQKGVFICQDDAGSPGDWIGACAGESMWVTTWMPVEDLLVSDLFAPWAKAFVSARTSFDGQVLNDKIEVLITFRQ